MRTIKDILKHKPTFVVIVTVSDLGNYTNVYKFDDYTVHQNNGKSLIQDVRGHAFYDKDNMKHERRCFFLSDRGEYRKFSGSGMISDIKKNGWVNHFPSLKNYRP